MDIWKEVSLTVLNTCTYHNHALFDLVIYPNAGTRLMNFEVIFKTKINWSSNSDLMLLYFTHNIYKECSDINSSEDKEPS